MSEPWLTNDVYDLDRRGNRRFFVIVTTLGTVIGVSLYLLFENVLTLITLPLALAVGAVAYSRVFMFPVMIRISEEGLDFMFRYKWHRKTYSWGEIVRVRVEHMKGDLLSPPHWESLRVDTSQGTREIDSINVSDEICRLIKTASHEYNPEIIWIESDS